MLTPCQRNVDLEMDTLESLMATRFVSSAALLLANNCTRRVVSGQKRHGLWP
jgi:hypothetical protein